MKLTLTIETDFDVSLSDILALSSAFRFVLRGFFPSAILKLFSHENTTECHSQATLASTTRPLH